MAILRDAKPEYSALVHTGVNAAGKTVKAPLDGICFAPGAEPPHMVTAHHTTSKRDALSNKWLHNPANVKAKKVGRPTMPAGDIIKTIKIVAAERQRDSSMLATLVLTTNQEPPEDLVREVHAVGRANCLNIDVWSASRLAHHLDNTAPGQWIRRQFLGIAPERLSRELLAALSRDSLAAQRLDDDPTAWVPRELDRAITSALRERDVIFVIAESGLGKSVASYKQLMQHVAQGGLGIILPHDVITAALTIEQAIDGALRQLHPALGNGAGIEALSICSPDSPLMVVIEDINKSGQAKFLAEKLAKWNFVQDTNVSTGSTPGNRPNRERWRLICPIWPQITASLSDPVRKKIESLAIIGAPLTATEGREAVKRRAAAKGM